jgi:hypothetical protein
MKKIASLALFFALALNSHAVRQGTSVTVSPGSMTTNTTTPPLTNYVSVWEVKVGLANKLYRYGASFCKIVKTGNNYSAKITAFGNNFVYTQTNSGELFITKTEIIKVSNTVRQVVKFNLSTNTNTASLIADVEVQTLVKNVWKTSIPSSTWLRSYSSIYNTSDL